MTKNLVLLVSIKGSYKEAKVCINKKVTDINYRRTLRDMTVQYWKIRNKAPYVRLVCGIFANQIYAAFQVNDEQSFDEMKYPIRSNGFPTVRIAFNCDTVRDDLIGLELLDENAFKGGNTIRTVEFDNFSRMVESQMATPEMKERMQVRKNAIMLQIKESGIPLDYEDHKRRSYDEATDYAQPKFGYERNRELNLLARKRANNKCQLLGTGQCDYSKITNESDRERLEVHHIDELHNNPIGNDYLNNMIVICRKFHRHFHYHIKPKEGERIKQIFKSIRV